jgi:hypothetical protein
MGIEMLVDVDNIKNEKDYFIALLLLEKVGQKLLRETPFQAISPRFRDLVKSLGNVKRNYLGVTKEDMEKIHEGVDPEEDEL